MRNKPSTPIHFDFDYIPEELKKNNNFTLWKLEKTLGNDGTPKLDKNNKEQYAKVPYQISGQKASTRDSSTWNTYERCKNAYDTIGGYSGIGYVFTKDDPYVVVDWDDVIKDGVIDSEVSAEIESLNSYAEISQSGHGVHCIFRGTKPGDKCRYKIEMYDKLRFMALTGIHIESTPEDIREAPQNAIDELYYKKVVNPKTSQKATKGIKKTSPNTDDKRILMLCETAKNADLFKALYEGDTTKHKSESNADLAFCNILAFYTQDEDQIDRIFRCSGLYRDKWDRADYRTQTIRRAIDDLPNIYQGASQKTCTHEPEVPDAPLPDLIADLAQKIDGLDTAKKHQEILVFCKDTLACVDDGVIGEVIREDVKDATEISADAAKDIVKAVNKHRKNMDRQQIKEQCANDINGIVEQLMAYAVQDAVLFHDIFGNPYAFIDNECMSVNGDKFMQRMRYGYYQDTGGAPSSETMKSAINTIAAKAIFDGECHELHNRVCSHEGAIWFDWGDGRAIKINNGMWEMVDDIPILFRRFGHQSPMDVELLPCGQGDAWKVLNHVNIKGDGNKLLFLVNLCTKIVPDISHAIDLIFGAQGAAKTTCGKVIKRLVDPSEIETTAMPSKTSDLVQLFDHNYVVNFDNVTRLTQEQSDILCRAVTGDAVLKRVLYSDDDDHITKYRRCTSINGITNVVSRPDLLDRAILTEVERVAPVDRLTDAEFWARFHKDKAIIIIGIFDVVAKAKALCDEGFDIKEKSRMADFEVWGSAICEALGKPHEDFRKAYKENKEDQNMEVLELSPIGRVLLLLGADGTRLLNFDGTPTELYTMLKANADKCHVPSSAGDGFPQGANSMVKHLNEIKANLLDEGIEYTRIHSGNTKISIKKI